MNGKYFDFLDSILNDFTTELATPLATLRLRERAVNVSIDSNLSRGTDHVETAQACSHSSGHDWLAKYVRVRERAGHDP